MDFHLLGPLEVCQGERALPLGSAKQRTLLADLLLHANEVVSVDRIVDDLWGERPPDTAEHMVHVYVSRLRKALKDGGGPSRLLTKAPGYLLRIAPPDSLDLDRARALSEEGRRALEHGDVAAASERLQEATSLWRGAPLADLATESFAAAEIARLEELQLSTSEARIDAELAMGRHAEVVAELRALVGRHPLREKLREQLMLGLYRSGRQAEALDAYREARALLAEELGVDPGPSLQAVESSILRQDPSLDHEPPPRRPRPKDRRSSLSRMLVVAAAAALAVAASVAGLSAKGPEEHGPAPGDRTVAIIDGASGRITGAVAVGDGPSAIAVGEGAAWVGNFDDRTLSKIDLATDEEVARIGDAGIPSAVAFGDGSVWVADAFAGRIVQIDPDSGRVLAKIERLDAPSAIVPDGGSIWVVDQIYDTVTRIDPRDGRILSTIPLPAGAGPSALATGEGALWVANQRDRSVTRIDPTTGRVVAERIALCCQPTAIAAGGGAVWVVSSRDDSVMRIDPAMGAVASTVPIGDRPSGLVLTSDGIWVTCAGDRSVWRLDSDGKVVSRTPVGGSPTAIAANGSQILVTVSRVEP